MAKRTVYWYLLTWMEMNGSYSLGDLPLEEKIGLKNRQNSVDPIRKSLEEYLGRPIRGVMSFSYYGSEVVDDN